PAADEIEPHPSARRWIYLLPTVHPRNGPRAQYIVLDASIPSLPVTPAALHRAAEAALNTGYGVLEARDGVLLLGRHHGTRRLPPAFFSFAYASSQSAQPVDARWRGLRLTAAVVHPRDGLADRSRPAIAVETYWRASRRLPRGTRVSFYLSPVYTGAHPILSPAWQADRDSPT